MPTDNAVPRVEIKLQHRRVGHQHLKLREHPSSEARALGILSPGAIVVSLAEVITLDQEKWLRIHSVLGDGYLPEKTLWRVRLEGDEALFELARRPRLIWQEPVRHAHADVTFTCTFNGRVAAFFDAMRSVLTNLDDIGSIDSWIIVCDRGATADQRAEIVRAMPWATLIAKGTALHTHAVSMNLILSLLRTRWWLQWEDDWTLNPGGGGRGVLSRSREVAMQGVHQVALNGAWLDHDSVWRGSRSKVSLEEHPPRHAVDGSGMPEVFNRWAEVIYPDDQRARITAGQEGIDSLIDSYLQGVQGNAGSPYSTGRSDISPRDALLWPLYSNQPSFNDAAFMRRLRFDESPPRSGAYWKFEFDFGLQFVRAGGRKASLRGVYNGWGHAMSGLAQQIAVESSSTAIAGSLSKEQRNAPTYIPIANAPREEGTRGEGDEDEDSVEDKGSMEAAEASRRKFAGGCTIGAVPTSAATTRAANAADARAVTSSAATCSSAATSAAPTATPGEFSDADAERLSAALTAKGCDVQALMKLAASPGGRLAAREKLIELGFGKVGERLRLEHALMRTLKGVGATT